MAKAKKTKEETALEKKKDQEAVMMQFDFGEDIGDGYDPESATDIQVPIIAIVQTNSPQAKPVERGGLGADVGTMFNTVTNEVMTEVRFVPAKSEKMYVEWVPRTEGGGFVAQHALDSEVVLNAKKNGGRSPFKLANGHELIETQYLYCVRVDENSEPTGEFFVISFTSTKLTAWRKWNTAVHSLRVPTPKGKQQPPLYSHVVRLSTVEQSNKQGDWHNFVLSPVNGDMKKSLVLPNDEAYSAAKNLRTLIESGAARAAESQTSGGTSEPEEDHF